MSKTITIEEFKNLQAGDSPRRTKAYGRFAISEKAQKAQCKNLKVGDKVFCLEAKDKGVGEDGIPQVGITIVALIVKEERDG